MTLTGEVHRSEKALFHRGIRRIAGHLRESIGWLLYSISN